MLAFLRGRSRCTTDVTGRTTIGGRAPKTDIPPSQKQPFAGHACFVPQSGPPGVGADVAQTLAGIGGTAILQSVYTPHPSQELTDLFRAKPYQGAPPQDAEFLFVGLDANYDADIQGSSAFARVKKYHEDGVAFWRDRKVHHPFLLADYKGSGQLYHRNFARIGFKPEDACRVSFVELLHIPTIGVSHLVPEDLDSAHLQWPDSLMKRGTRRKVFLSVSRRTMLAACFARILPWRRTPGVGPHCAD